jgi:hypothetical protein
MRSITFFSVVILLFGAGFVFAEDGELNFAGEWTLDREKSEIPEGRGGRRGRAATKMIVTQEENKLVVESTSTNRDGEERIIKATYTLDGKECENEMYNTTSKSTAEWSEDGKSLEINTEAIFSRNGQEFNVKVDSRWSQESGNIIIESTRTTSRGERKSKLLYVKADTKEQ